MAANFLKIGDAILRKETIHLLYNVKIQRKLIEMNFT